MKKLFFFLILITSFLVQPVMAQRFGTTPSQDNTYRPLNLGLVTYTLATGVDTLKLTPRVFETHVRCATTLSDSLAVRIQSVAGSKLGDKVYLQFRSDGSSRKLKLVSSTNLIVGSTTSITLAANKSVVITLYFDGTRWIEASRFVQP